jgi:CDP-diacylglycerol--serine O-phosphatidyltransferase
MATTTAPEHRLLFRPAALLRFEARAAAHVRLHPNTLSLAKLALTLPMFLVLSRGAAMWSAPLTMLLFTLFAGLDYLDGVVARGRGLATPLGRVLDRATDYPMLLMLAWFCADVLPPLALGLKIGLDLLLLGLYMAGRGSTENRVRTTLSYTTLLSLLLLGQGWAPRLATPGLVTALLVLNIVLSTAVVLYNLRLLRDVHFADALSLANLASGVASMVFAARGMLPLSILMLLCGAVLDGLDGAAARRWGSSPWGVLADDVADAISYGVAPAFALAVTLGGAASVALGVTYAVFTVGRLLFFTAMKADSDPAQFRGAPSTLGGLVVLCGLQLFTAEPLLVGVLVGAACTLMVGFDVRYRHLARALKRRVVMRVVPLASVVLFGAWLAFGSNGPVTLLLLAALGYGFAPTAAAFTRALHSWRARRQEPLA